MGKTLLYRLFRCGAIPGDLRKAFGQEGIIVADEGMGGWFIAKNFKAPGKRYKRRAESFSGFLVVTRKRISAYTYSKCQINISAGDSRIPELYTRICGDGIISLSFNVSSFRENSRGVLEFRFKTPEARSFYKALTEAGVSPGYASDS